MKQKYLFFLPFLLFNFILAAQEIPQIETQPSDQTVCEGDSAGFMVEASGIGDLKYQWQKDGVDIAGETDSLLIILSTLRSDSGDYRCIVSNQNGNDTSEVAVLTVDYLLPTVLLGPHEVENYDTALFSVVPVSGHTYTFYVEEGVVVESSDTSVHVEWDADEVGFVRVVETNSNGCQGDTVSRLVIIGNVAPFFLSHPESQIICEGDSVVFSAPAAGTSDLHYQWQLNEEDILRETNEILIIPAAEMEDEGNYRCIASNTVGADTSETAVLDIDEVIPAEIIGSNEVDQLDTIVYHVIPEAEHSYEFSVSGGIMYESSDTSISVIWDTPGISFVHLVETNTLGCIGDTVDYQVLVYGEGTMIIFLDQPESQGVCVDDSVSFTVKAAGYPELVFQWQKDGENIEGANDSIYIIQQAQFEDQAAYRCVVNNDFGADTSEVAQLQVDEINPTDIIGPQYVEEFEIVLYSVAHTEGHVYQFNVEGGNIIETTQNTATVHWGGSGYGKVMMLESVENGCVGDWIELDIFVGTVGIESENENAVSVYPNPVLKQLTIESRGINTFRLYNMVGNLVTEENFKNKAEIDLSFLEPGMYIYRMGDVTGRLIKK